MNTHQVPVAVCVDKTLIKESARFCLQHVEGIVPLCFVQERRGSALRVDQETPHVTAAEHQVFIACTKGRDAEFSASLEHWPALSDDSIGLVRLETCGRRYTACLIYLPTRSRGILGPCLYLEAS